MNWCIRIILSWAALEIQHTRHVQGCEWSLIHWPIKNVLAQAYLVTSTSPACLLIITTQNTHSEENFNSENSNFWWHLAKRYRRWRKNWPLASRAPRDLGQRFVPDFARINEKHVIKLPSTIAKGLKRMSINPLFYFQSYFDRIHCLQGLDFLIIAIQLWSIGSWQLRIGNNLPFWKKWKYLTE